MSDLVKLPTSDDITSAIRGCQEKQAHAFATAFRLRREESPDQGWGLLEDLFGMNFRPRNLREPFGAARQFDGQRTLVPGDLTTGELTALAGTVDSVADPEYRARILDVLWLRRRDPTAARAAVDAYLDSGARVEDPKHWVLSIERYQRALCLALQVDSKGESPHRVLRHLEARVLYYNGEDPLYFARRALDLLADHAFGDLQALAGIAGRVAETSRAAHNFDRARSYFAVQARLLKAAKSPEGAESARVAEAECFALEAEDREGGGSFLAAHHFWQEALRAFRDRASLRSRIPELQRRMAAAGRSAMQEMQVVGVKLDIAAESEKARTAIKGLSLEDAFFTVLTFVPMIDPAQLRQQVIDAAAAFPLQPMIEAHLFDAAGRVVGKRPSLATDDPEQRKAAIEGLMEQSAGQERQLRAVAYIGPGVEQFLEDHELDEETIVRLVGDSELIPDDRRPYFLQGIMAGFRGDFAAALHWLIPQIENGLRVVLDAHGFVPRTVDPDGVEEVWSFERVLDHPLITDIFGPELVFELRSLTVARLGTNFRNLIAHGLISADALNSETGRYLWWVLLHLIARGAPEMDNFLQRRATVV